MTSAASNGEVGPATAGHDPEADATALPADTPAPSAPPEPSTAGEVGEAGEAIGVEGNGHHPDTAWALAVTPAPASPRPPDARYVTVGALQVVGRRAARLGRRATGLAGAVGRPAATAAGAMVPEPVRRAAIARLRELDEQGRAAVRATATEANEAADKATERVGNDRLVLKLVDQVVGNVQWRLIDEILPVVLERLAKEPDQVRDIVQGQSRGMIEEVAQAARSRAASGDEAVDRFVSRLLRRRDPGTADGAQADGRSPAR